MHYTLGWYITVSVVPTTLSVGHITLSVGHITPSVGRITLLVGRITLSVGCITLSVVHTTLSVLSIYGLGCMHYSVSCQQCTLSVVCTTLSVVNIYSVSCTYYSWLVHYSFCCMHQSVGWYITLSVAELLFWLDPLLCCTHYMLLALSHSSTLALVADNAKGFPTIRSISDCESLKSDIDNLVEWSDEWNLDTDECSLCSVIRKHEPVTYDYTMGTKTLIRVDNQRDLGVLITCDARFDEYIYAHVNKANKMLGLIHRTIMSNIYLH